MKKVIWIIIVLAIIGLGLYFFRGSSSGAANPNSSESSGTAESPMTFVPSSHSDSALLARLQNANVSLSEDGKNTKLVNGTSGAVSLYTTSSGENVDLAKSVASRNDVLAIVNLSSKEDVSQYLILFGDNGTSLTQKSIAYVGQGLEIRDMTIADLGAGSGEDYVVTITSRTQASKTTTFIVPVKDAAFDTAHSLSL